MEEQELSERSIPERAKSALSRAVNQEIDWNSQHFKDTPKRWAKMIADMTTQKEFEFTAFESTADEMIIIRDIPFVSLCAHHVVPFMGVAHIGYVPNGKIAGLSKFARAVDYYAAKLTVQEELTKEVGNTIEHELLPAGVIVVMQAEHLCMTIRGVQKPGTQTVTSYVTGVFADHDRTAKAEFMALLGLGR